MPAPRPPRRAPPPLREPPRRPPPRAGRSSAAGSAGPPGQLPPDEVALGQLDRRATGQAQAAVRAPRDRPTTVLVGIVDGTRRLVVGREVAARVVGAPPEDVAGPPRATRDELAVAVLGAHHLERELVGRRRAVPADVRAVRVARAADERPELAAPGRQDALAALRAGIAVALELGRLLARQRARLLVLGVGRAGEELPVAAEADDHRVALRADLVAGLGGDVAALDGLADLVDALLERAEERAQQRDPRPVALGDLVELLLHPGREREVHVLAEVQDEEVGHDLADLLGMQAPLLDPDVAAIDDRRDRRGIGRRAADAVLLERLDQRRLRVPRRRLGEVLGGRDVEHACDVALGQRRQRALRLLGGVVLALRVDPGEAVEQGPGRRGAKPVVARLELDRRGLELLGRHLRGDGALPDQAVEAVLLGLERRAHGLRVPLERRRADRLVRLLGALRAGLVDPALAGPVALAEAVLDDALGLGHRDARDRRRVGPHVGDQADVPVRGVDALVQPLGDAHRPLGAEAELAARLLLERAGRERRRGVALRLALGDRLDDRLELAQRGGVPAGGLVVGDVERLAVDPDDLGDQLAAVGRGEQGLERPVLAGGERPDLALALHDHPQRDGLDAAGRQAAAHLAGQEGAERVADEAVDDAAGLLRIHEVAVDLARAGEGLADRALRDLVERHPARLGGGNVGRLGDVPGDRLALAVEVGREIDVDRPAGGLLDRGDLLAPVVGDHVLRREVVVDVDAELALAGVLGQVADVAIGGEDLVVVAEVALDRPRLGGRFHDHEVLGHGGRECSTGSFAASYPAGQAGGRTARPTSRCRGPAGGSPRRSRCRGRDPRRRCRCRCRAP